MLRNKKRYKLEKGIMENTVEIETSELAIGLEIESNETEFSERDEGNAREKQTRKPESEIDNSVLSILIAKLSEMEDRTNKQLAELKTESNKQFAESVKQLSEMENRTNKQLAEMEDRSNKQLKEIKTGTVKQLAEMESNLTNSLENRLDESLKRLESKLNANNQEIESKMKEKLNEQSIQIRSEVSESIQHLGSQIDQKMISVENRFEKQVETVEEIGIVVEKLEQTVAIELNIVEKKVGETINIMDAKIGKVQDTLRETLEKLEINSKKIVTSNREQSMSDNNVHVDKCEQNPEQNLSRNWSMAMADVVLPKFGNENNQNPLKFIRELENFFEMRAVPERMKLTIVKNCLTHNAASWFEMLNTDESVYHDFKKRFLDHYWDKNKQDEIRLKLNNGKFNPKGYLKMADYFIQIGQLSKLLEPPIQPQELINIVANHYNPEIRSAIIISKPKSCEEMITLLKELQGNSSHFNNNQTTEYVGNRNRQRTEGEGAQYVPNRYRNNYLEMQGPQGRKNNPQNNNNQYRNNWTRENNGNGQNNQWEADRRNNNQDNRNNDRRMNPRVNYINFNRVQPYSTGNRQREDRNRGGTYQNRWSYRDDYVRNERPPSPYRHQNNQPVRMENRERLFPPGINGECVDRLINNQNTRPQMNSQGINQPARSEN